MVAILFSSCSGKKENTRTVNANVEQIEVVAKTKTDSIKGRNHNMVEEVADVNTKIDTTKGAETDQESLNDIRFAGWTEKDWLDNEYIRTLRQYIDKYNSGKVKNETLNPYRKFLKSKFVVGHIEDAYFGGVTIDITFIDNPAKVFTAWVYSDVNSETKKVSNYKVISMNYKTEIEGFSKNELQQLIKKHPEFKAW